jgi:hypothetical protein
VYQSFQLSSADVLISSIAIVGGGLLLFQSIRFLKHAPSSRFTIPLWICTIAYLAVLILRVVITQNIVLSITNPGILASGTPADIFASILLIGLEGFLACAFLILLVIKWLSSPSDTPTWRRMIATVAYSACAAIGVWMITARLQLAGEELYYSAGASFYPQCTGDFLSWICLTQTAVWNSYIIPFLIKTLLLVGLIPSFLAFLLPKVRTQTQTLLLGLACGAGIVLTTHITDIDPSLLPLLPLQVDYFIIVSARALVICTSSAFVTVGWYLLIHKQRQALVQTLLYWFGSLLATWFFLLLERAFATAEPLRSIIMILILIIALASFFLFVRSLKSPKPL